MMDTKMVEMYGEMVEVRVVKPSRRKATSSIQQPRYNKGHQQGAKHVAREADQFLR